MLKTLRRLFNARQPVKSSSEADQSALPQEIAPPSLSAFNSIDEQRRAIFRFWDGSEMRAADPMRIWIAIETDPEFNSDRHPIQADGEDPKIAAEAAMIMGRMVCRAFGVKEFDGEQGLVLTELLALYSAFAEFTYELKKNTDPSLMPPPSSVATSANYTEETTKDSAASGSTSAAVNCDRPTEHV